MKNKTLAFFGIGAYILSIIASATDLEGNSTMPIALIAISGIVTAVFIIMVIIRLWQVARSVAIIFLFSAIILFILSVIQNVTSPSYGSSIIILLNITKVVNFITFIWAVFLLLAMKKGEGSTKNYD